MQGNSSLPTNFRIIFNKTRANIDKLAIHPRKRWAFFTLTFLLFFIRMIVLDGFYAMMYLYAFYIVQNLIQYITPSDLPTIQEEEEMANTIYDIPDTVSFSKNEDESKPVIRKLGEFKLWFRN